MKKIDLNLSFFSEKCGGIHNNTSGSIKSPNFPGNYSNNVECIHEINVNKDRTIKLMFK